MDSSVVQLKTIEYQMNKHLKNKHGDKHKKVNIDVSQKNSYNPEKFDSFVNKEIDSSIIKKKWASLPVYFKWRCIQEYLAENNISDNETVSKIRTSLANNTLTNISYDPVEQKVTSISI